MSPSRVRLVWLTAIYSVSLGLIMTSRIVSSGELLEHVGIGGIVLWIFSGSWWPRLFDRRTP